MSAIATSQLEKFHEQFEQYRCPNPACDAALPREAVAANIDKKTGVRHVKVLCPHCEMMHEARFELRGGTWCMLGKVEQVTDERRRKGMKARLDQLSGQMQATAH